LSRYDSAALTPAISTGFMDIQLKMVPVSSSSITPEITAVRKAIRRPLEKSFQSSVKNFDFIA
jgi:hypothetical protein